jgi:hypothetical protein
MSFSASTCITIPAGVTTSGFFNIYSNVGNYVNPFQTNVSYYQLVGATTPQGVVYSCPYIMGNVPDGTTIIKIIDTTTKCCVTIDLLSNDLCTTCELGFDDYETNTIGVIVAGELTGSCQNVISDYRILWYGPNDPNELAFTSGFGTDPDFLPRDFTHPLTGINSPMQPAGTYVPVIDKIKLNGLDFSQTGGSGYIQAELECFNATTINLQPFTCDNGTEVGNYTHRVNFAGAAAGVTPLSLQSTFDLDITTDYFAWKFKGEDITDSIKITFYGSAYSEPIILEFITIGLNTVSNFTLSTLPKSGSTSQYLSKVTSLTSLTRNTGDYLILEVIPNPNNQQTNWDFYFTCLETFDCSLCTDSYVNTNTPYKIKLSTISNTPGTCGYNSIFFNLSGCTQSLIENSDIYKYMLTNAGAVRNIFQFGFGSNTSGLFNTGIGTTLNYTSCNYGTVNPNLFCATPNTNTITFLKSNTGTLGQGVINMTFTDFNDLVAYKSSYESTKTSSGWVNDSTNINYYKHSILSIPNTIGSQSCGDSITPLSYNIHFSSVVTTGQTSSNYTLSFTMPTIQNNLPPFTNCEVNCVTSLTNFINAVNNDSTGTTNNRVFTNNVGSRYTLPASRYGVFQKSVSNSPTGSVQGYYAMNNSLNTTMPFSGSSSPYVQIPALSSQTCDFSSKGQTINANSGFQYQEIFLYDYQIIQGNTLNTYTIKANPIVNGIRTSTTYPDTAVTVSNGVVTYSDPLYTF